VAWLTYADLVRFGIEYIGAYDRARAESLRFVKLAIESSLREILAEHDWSFLQKDTTILSKPPYLTGTITYVASTRTVTLTGGTWPTWAADGVIQIADRWYDVESRTSDTVLVMKQDAAPPNDIASASAYGLYQDVYDLPADFSVLKDICRMNTWQGLSYQSPQELFDNRQSWRTAGTPDSFTIYGSPNTPGRMSIRFCPVPDEAEEFPLLYKRAPKILAIYKETTGKVTLTAGSAAIVGSGTDFSSRHVGAILRVGQDGTSFPGSSNEEAPNVFEAKIIAVTDSTNLTVDTLAAENLTSRSLCISDPVDIEQTTMTSLMHRAICRRLAIDRKMDANTRQLADTDYGNELLRSKMADSRTTQRRSVGFAGTVFRRLKIGPNAWDG
jgi:hypothetical protein